LAVSVVNACGFVNCVKIVCVPVEDMEVTERVSDEEIEELVLTSLALHPDAMVGALGPDAWLMPMPGSFPLGGRRVLDGGSAIELLLEEERDNAFAAWGRVRTVGKAHLLGRFEDDPETPYLFVLADMRTRHGVFILVAIANGVPEPETPSDDGQRVKPRICRMRRSSASHVLEAEESATRMFGWSHEELAGRRSLDLVHPDDHERAVGNWLDMLSMPGHDARWRGRYLNSDGTWTWVEITNTNRLNDPEHGDVMTEMVNIDEEMSMLEAIRAREQLFRELTEALPVGVLQFDAHEKVVFANPRLREILGVRLIERVAVLRSLVAPDHVPLLDRAIASVLGDAEAVDLELQLDFGPGDRSRTCQMNLRPLHDAEGVVDGVIACLSDVTDSVRLRDELQERANFDDLTGCHNRASTLRHLARFLANGQVGVVFIDLDEFKQVNDTYGHAIGDELLSHAANRLRSNVRREDVVGRIGGDEFVVLYPGVATHEQLTDLVSRLSRVFESQIVLGEVSLHLQASFGAAFGPTGANAEEVLARADSAMYAVKKRQADLRAATPVDALN
jgi:diguanylate cyclase (GGDEF)-like protein/PAS domain S-box-containing protein